MYYIPESAKKLLFETIDALPIRSEDLEYLQELADDLETQTSEVFQSDDEVEVMRRFVDVIEFVKDKYNIHRQVKVQNKLKVALEEAIKIPEVEEDEDEKAIESSSMADDANYIIDFIKAKKKGRGRLWADGTLERNTSITEFYLIEEDQISKFEKECLELHPLENIRVFYDNCMGLYKGIRLKHLDKEWEKFEKAGLSDLIFEDWFGLREVSKYYVVFLKNQPIDNKN